MGHKKFAALSVAALPLIGAGLLAPTVPAAAVDGAEVRADNQLATVCVNKSKRTSKAKVKTVAGTTKCVGKKWKPAKKISRAIQRIAAAPTSRVMCIKVNGINLGKVKVKVVGKRCGKAGSGKAGNWVKVTAADLGIGDGQGVGLDPVDNDPNGSGSGEPVDNGGDDDGGASGGGQGSPAVPAQFDQNANGIADLLEDLDSNGVVDGWDRDEMTGAPKFFSDSDGNGKADIDDLTGFGLEIPAGPDFNSLPQ